MEKLPKNPKSEAALKWCIKNWGQTYTVTSSTTPTINVYCLDGNFDDPTHVAEIDFRELVKKRQPLKGIQKEVMRAVRAHPKKKTATIKKKALVKAKAKKK